jgi:muramoyltetrapeptide carboxypeptidase LdcA involved in peptidoglycan recycling
MAIMPDGRSDPALDASGRRYPVKPRPGDRVAVLSPAAGVPALFPHVYQRGLARLREAYAVEPVEYPTTRQLGASAEDRARDIHAAFADPGIAAVIASIGGQDQITVIPHLDGDLLRANPKPFFGFSDNTNLHNYLWNLGLVSYYGGSVMVNLGRSGRENPDSARSFRSALFDSGWFDLIQPDAYTDEAVDWNLGPAALVDEPTMFPAPAWEWRRADRLRIVEAPTWGGCIEVLAWILQVGRDVAPADAYAGHVLMIETSEEMPRADDVYWTLRSMALRGLLADTPAVLVGRPKAWNVTRPNTPDQKRRYAEEQREAVLRALDRYVPDALVVLDVDFGHTDPQSIMPYGGSICLDASRRTISVRY